MNRFLVSVAALSVAAASAQAQVTSPRDTAPGSYVTRGHGAFYVEPYAGYFIGGNLTKSSAPLTLEDKPIYGAQLGYSFSPNFTLVGNVGYSKNNFAYETRGATGVNTRASNDVDLLLYDADLQFRLPYVANKVGSTIAPFAQVGLGAIKFSPDRGNELNDFKKGPTNIAYNAGVGVDIQVRKFVGVRLMAKDYLTSLAYDDLRTTAETVTRTSDNKVSNNVALTAGLNIGF